MSAAALARARNLISEAGVVAGGLCILGTLAGRYPSGFRIAEKLFRLAISMQPGCAEPYVSLGARLLGIGRTGEAITLLAQAQAIKPNCGETSHVLAMAELTDGRFDERRPVPSAHQFGP